MIRQPSASTMDWWTGTPAVTPSATAQLTPWGARTMSPVAYTPASVIRLAASVRMTGPNGPSSSAQPSRSASGLFICVRGAS